MKLSHEKENEVSVLRKRLERATDDMLTLRNENLELYRRLRVVRASSRGTAAGISATAQKGTASSRSTQHSIQSINITNHITDSTLTLPDCT